LVQVFEQQGWSVWWDRQILPGKTFDEVIEEALGKARCVVVLWSETSVRSEWVKTEAAEAAQRDILVPILLDPVKIPLEFRRIQAARLIGWKGEQTHPEFLQLLQAVSRLLEQSSGEHARKEPETRDTVEQTREESQIGGTPPQVIVGRQVQPPNVTSGNERSTSGRQFMTGGVVVLLAFLVWESRSIFFQRSKTSFPENVPTREEQLASTESPKPDKKGTDFPSRKTATEQTLQPESPVQLAPQPAPSPSQPQDEAPPRQEQTRQPSPPQPSETDQAREDKTRKEKELLAKAEKQIAKGRLTTPSGDNALETYQALLRLTPEHDQARVGLQTIQQYYRKQAEAAAKTEKWSTARAQYEKALTILPDDATILAALQQVKEEEQAAAARAEQARQHQNEAHKALAQPSPSPNEQTVARTESQKPSRTVEVLLTEKKPPQAPNPAEQAAALLRAAERGDVNSVKQSLALHAPVNAADPKGKTPLMYAAAVGNSELVELLLAKGAEVNQKNAGGGTALMYAAWNGHVAIVQTLLAKGADINAQDNDGWSALIDAARNGHGEVVRLLLARGAQINLKSNDGETALGEARAKNHTDVVSLLTQAGAR
jgi:ankyrin repeat protein